MRRVNKKKHTIDEAFGDYDYLYGIVSTATEWYFILYSTNGIACTSRSPYNIRFIEAALVKNSKEEKELHENVKKIVEIIVGLLKDRVEVENISAKKKSRIDQIMFSLVSYHHFSTVPNRISNQNLNKVSRLIIN